MNSITQETIQILKRKVDPRQPVFHLNQNIESAE